MMESIRLWWMGWRRESVQTDTDLDDSTRAISVAIVQTLSNRSFRRPELSSGAPLDSALEQRQFDEETVQTYQENIWPKVEQIREEYLARNEWSPSLERLAKNPDGPDDLRDLTIRLERLRDGLRDE